MLFAVIAIIIEGLDRQISLTNQSQIVPVAYVQDPPPTTPPQQETPPKKEKEEEDLLLEEDEDDLLFDDVDDLRLVRQRYLPVLASPLAMIIGLTWGFLSVGLIALGLYVFAGLVFLRLPRA